MADFGELVLVVGDYHIPHRAAAIPVSLFVVIVFFLFLCFKYISCISFFLYIMSNVVCNYMLNRSY